MKKSVIIFITIVILITSFLLFSSQIQNCSNSEDPFQEIPLQNSSNSKDLFQVIPPQNGSNSEDSFQELPLSDKPILVKTLLSDIYRRDSTSVIKDFEILLNPDQYHYYPFDSIPINEVSDTVFIRLTQSYPGDVITTRITAWNKKMAVTAGVVGNDCYGYDRKTGLRDWEQRLIEDWDVDSIHTLMKPTFYSIDIYPEPTFYVFQIVINNKKAKSRTVRYGYLHVPYEYKNDPVRSKQDSPCDIY